MGDMSCKVESRGKCFGIKIFFNVYSFLRERDRQNASGGEAERERHTQNPKQALGSELSAQNLTQGLSPQTVTDRKSVV